MTTELSIGLDDELDQEFTEAMREYEETKPDLVRRLIRTWVDEQNK